MRMHIDLIICHFLLSTVSITEGPKNKIVRKSGIHKAGVPKYITYCIFKQHDASIYGFVRACILFVLSFRFVCPKNLRPLLSKEGG